MYNLEGRTKLAFLLLGAQEEGLQSLHMTGTTEGYSGWVRLINPKTKERYNVQDIMKGIPDGAIEQTCFVLDPATTLNSEPWYDDVYDSIPKDEDLSVDELKARKWLEEDLGKQLDHSRNYMIQWLERKREIEKSKRNVVTEL